MELYQKKASKSSILAQAFGSCLMNNGNEKKHFLLERGVRPGCPLSGILFIIAIDLELLSQSIRRSNKIKSIIIQENQEVKFSQYADGTTTLLAIVQSIFNLLDLLSLFEKCSCLKINPAKSEMLWLGSWRQRKDRILNLNIQTSSVNQFMHLTYDRTGSDWNFFFVKLESLRKTKDMWSQRDIPFMVE